MFRVLLCGRREPKRRIKHLHLRLCAAIILTEYDAHLGAFLLEAGCFRETYWLVYVRAGGVGRRAVLGLCIRRAFARRSPPLW